jgi:glycerol-3-phosphate dehydrogenase
MFNFSSSNRIQILQEAQSEIFDIIVIGGGITGAGIALDAASRGLSVLLLEKDDFASGTSSRSTKLIHGGLRYLKQLEFKLVRQVGLERAILYKNAKHLVRPEPMLLPIIEGGSLGKVSTSFALWLYEFLAGVPLNEQKRMLNSNECIQTEPLMDSAIIRGGALYTEYRTDDARLTITVLKTAVKIGAKAVNHAAVIDLVYDNGKIKGVRVQEKSSHSEFQILAHTVVNAAGPWVDEIRLKEGPLVGKQLHLTQGIHLVVQHKKFALKQAVYFDSSDKRMIFAIPRDGCTYIGTTDTNYSGDKSNPTISVADVQYLLDACNLIFPTIHLSQNDVISSWSGLRPLIHEEGKSPSELSRKDELFISASGMISIAGGKLTGYRLMAKRVVDEIALKLNRNELRLIPKSRTEELKLSGGDFIDEHDIIEFKDILCGQAKQVNCTYNTIDEWVNRYGKDAEHIVEIAFALWPEISEKEWVPDIAEMHYVIHFEMCLHPSDYFVRRTSNLYFNRENLLRKFDVLYPWFVKIAQLNNEVAKQFAEQIINEIDLALDFK